jgi:hypothetical protein
MTGLTVEWRGRGLNDWLWCDLDRCRCLCLYRCLGCRCFRNNVLLRQEGIHWKSLRLRYIRGRHRSSGRGCHGSSNRCWRRGSRYSMTGLTVEWRGRGLNDWLGCDCHRCNDLWLHGRLRRGCFRYNILLRQEGIDGKCLRLRYVAGRKRSPGIVSLRYIHGSSYHWFRLFLHNWSIRNRLGLDWGNTDIGPDIVQAKSVESLA